MKHALALAILLLAATGWGQSQTNQIALRLEKMESAVIWTNAPYNRIGTNTSYGVVLYTPTDEEIIKAYAASGEICKVFGHCYPDIWLSSDGRVIERKCKLCGKAEPNWRNK